MVMFKISNKICKTKVETDTKINGEKICLKEDPFCLANSTTDPILVYLLVFFFLTLPDSCICVKMFFS